MTHLPYIITAYAITILTMTGIWITSLSRLKHNEDRLKNLKKQYHET